MNPQIPNLQIYAAKKGGKSAGKIPEWRYRTGSKQNDLETIKNCDLDFFFAQSTINMMSDEQFALYMEFADKMNVSAPCTGFADYALLICKMPAG